MKFVCMIMIHFIQFLINICFRRRDMVYLPDDDPEMEEAKRHARETLSSFKTILANPRPGMEHFAVKVAFEANGNSEHCWVSNLVMIGDQLHGELSNDPEFVEGWRLGDACTIEEERISDWAYSEDGVYQGHFTTKVLLPHLDREVREQIITIYGWDRDVLEPSLQGTP